MSFATFLFYLFVFILSSTFLLSVTGKSAGVRRFFVRLLIRVLEWISRQQDELEDELEDNRIYDEIENVGSGGVEPDENRAATFERRKRRRMSGLVHRRWSVLINKKLNVSDVDTDPEYESISAEDQPQGDVAKVIIDNSLEFLTAGVEAIVEDDVTSRFSAAQLASWNLLTRSRTHVHINWKLRVLWAIGLTLRYLILLPIRIALFSFAVAILLVGSLILGLIPNERFRMVLNKRFMLLFMRMMSTAFSSIIYFHGRENRAKSGIVVANHTSPIDVLILSTDNCYAMVGQRHGGILGFMQSAISRCAHHIWFERSESRDRNAVRKTLEDHVNHPDKLPILIFPEGTCINNTSVMLFKKGAFEVTDIVYPVAIKYDNRLGDAFWNSSEQSIPAYILSIMTSWALICDVWYLPPVRRKPGEDAADFARRVKFLIAKKGGLVSLEWDGNLKRSMVPERLKNAQKELFYQYLARTQRLLPRSEDDDLVRLKNTKSMPNMDKLNSSEVACNG